MSRFSYKKMYEHAKDLAKYWQRRTDVAELALKNAVELYNCTDAIADCRHCHVGAEAMAVDPVAYENWLKHVRARCTERRVARFLEEAEKELKI